jgi:hypothetical protein
MQKLTRDDLLPLERYAAERPAFRARVIAHKALRTLHLGPHVTLVFEDRLTVQYQVQEMLRIERIFEAAGIEDELAAYNPLIPDGGNLKATMLIEFPDPEQRRVELARLKGVERQVWLQAGEGAKAFAIADEDLERENEEKTSSVHFLRFELDAGARAALAGGAPLVLGCDHPAYGHRLAVPEASRRALAADLA